jgi:hypothetical protein
VPAWLPRNGATKPAPNQHPAAASRAHLMTRRPTPRVSLQVLPGSVRERRLSDLEEMSETGSHAGDSRRLLCYAVLCCAVLCYAMLCYAMLCCAALRCAALCCAVLCCAVLCDATTLAGARSGRRGAPCTRHVARQGVQCTRRVAAARSPRTLRNSPHPRCSMRGARTPLCTLLVDGCLMRRSSPSAGVRLCRLVAVLQSLGGPLRRRAQRPLLPPDSQVEVVLDRVWHQAAPAHTYLHPKPYHRASHTS